MDLNLLTNSSWLLLAIVMWELVWKGLALYRAARSDQKYWFAAILFINSAGLLPIVYLLIRNYQKKGIKAVV